MCGFGCVLFCFVLFPEDLLQLNASLSLISEGYKGEQKILLSTLQNLSHMQVLQFFHLRNIWSKQMFHMHNSYFGQHSVMQTRRGNASGYSYYGIIHTLDQSYKEYDVLPPFHLPPSNNLCLKFNRNVGNTRSTHLVLNIYICTTHFTINIFMQCKARHIPVALFWAFFYISRAKINARLFASPLILAANLSTT